MKIDETQMAKHVEHALIKLKAYTKYDLNNTPVHLPDKGNVPLHKLAVITVTLTGLVETFNRSKCIIITPFEFSNAGAIIKALHIVYPFCTVAKFGKSIQFQVPPIWLNKDFLWKGKNDIVEYAKIMIQLERQKQRKALESLNKEDRKKAYTQLDEITNRYVDKLKEYLPAQDNRPSLRERYYEKRTTIRKKSK